MKVFTKRLLFVAFSLIASKNCAAQFFESLGPLDDFHVPAGSTVTFKTSFIMGHTHPPTSWNVKLVPSPGVVSTSPSSFFAEDYSTTPITITIKSDTFGCLCWPCMVNAEGDSGRWAYNHWTALGVFYNPNIVGKLKAPGTLDFGRVAVGHRDSLRYSITLWTPDSLAIYRTFQPVRISLPFAIFAINDTPGLSYTCTTSFSYAYFEPTKIGHYIDTAYLLDPLTNDSIPLVLIGNAYDAGVAEDAAPQVKLFPNPCDQTLNVWLASEGISAVEIRNLLGEKVYSSRRSASELSVDCSSLPAGIYFARISTSRGAVQRQLVIAH